MKSLNGMPESRTVAFTEDIRPNLDDIIRPHPDKKSIESSMMEVAQSQPVLYEWLAFRFPVGDDVRCVQEFFMPKPTKSALPAISFKNALSEGTLMKADPYGRGDIFPPRGVGFLAQNGSPLNFGTYP